MDSFDIVFFLNDVNFQEIQFFSKFDMFELKFEFFEHQFLAYFMKFQLI